MPAGPGWKVAVVTTSVPSLESLAMLEKTIRALIALEYPHDTWVLDEENDDRMRELCRKLGANYFSRRNLPQYRDETGTFQYPSKHGNYNAWFYQIGFDRYDIITTFDPDHIPEANFLQEVLGYFEDPRIGYVQVAQAYYNQKASFIAQGAAEETYSYYSCIQMGSYRMGFPILVGCHNTHRVNALKELGGFPCHDAEDLFLTLLYRSRDWHGVYIPKILARGLTPVDWSGYLGQQRRWARSVLDIKFRIYPKLLGRFSLSTRIMSFLHGINYVHRSMIICLSVILMGFMLGSGIAPRVISQATVPRLGVLCAVLQLCEFYRQRFYLDWRNEWGLHWRVAVLNWGKWPYMLLAAFDVLLNREVPYAVTRKVKGKRGEWMLMWPNMAIIALMCIAWTLGMILHNKPVSSAVRVMAAAVVMISLALVMTERMNFPEPYDENFGLR